MDKMRSRAVATAKLLEDTAEYMRGVKDARADDIAAKREREVRLLHAPVLAACVCEGLGGGEC